MIKFCNIRAETASYICIYSVKSFLVFFLHYYFKVGFQLYNNNLDFSYAVIQHTSTSYITMYQNEYRLT